MKKQVLRHVIPAALAAVLLAGCGQTPGTASSVPAGSGAAPTAAPGVTAGPTLPPTAPPQLSPLSMDDGRLRILDKTVFCGADIVYTCHPNGRVYTLADGVDNDPQLFVAARPEGSDQYHYTIRDAAGQLVYDCGALRPGELCRGWLTLWSNSSAIGWSETDVMTLVQLATGRTLTLEPGAMGLQALDTDTLAVTRMFFPPEGGATQSVTTLYNNEMEPKALLEGYDLLNYGVFNGWVAARNDSGDAVLYNLDTGEELPDFRDIQPDGIAILTGPGLSRAIDLHTGRELARSEREIVRCFGGHLVTGSHDGGWALDIQWADGTVWEGITLDAPYNARDPVQTVLVYSESTFALCDTDGTLLWQQELDDVGTPISHLYTDRLPGERILVNLYLEGDQILRRIYSADGIVWESSDYTSVYAPNGCDYLFCSRTLPTGGYLQDVRTLDGALLVASVRSEGMPEPQFFSARQGFYTGWMDLQGRWLYRQSIWNETEDETQYWEW